MSEFDKIDFLDRNQVIVICIFLNSIEYSAFYARGIQSTRLNLKQGKGEVTSNCCSMNVNLRFVQSLSAFGTITVSRTSETSPGEWQARRQ